MFSNILHFNFNVLSFFQTFQINLPRFYLKTLLFPNPESEITPQPVVRILLLLFFLIAKLPYKTLETQTLGKVHGAIRNAIVSPRKNEMRGHRS